MKGSLIIVGFFALGVACGRGRVFPIDPAQTEVSFYALCALMFCVGLGLGSDPQTLRNFRSLSPRLMLLPLGTVAGTLAGAAAVSLMLAHRSAGDCLATGHGGTPGQHHPRTADAAARPAAGPVVRSAGTHLGRRCHDDGHDAARHHAGIGPALRHRLHLPRLSGRFQRALPRHAILQPLRRDTAFPPPEPLFQTATLLPDNSDASDGQEPRPVRAIAQPHQNVQRCFPSSSRKACARPPVSVSNKSQKRGP